MNRRQFLRELGLAGVGAAVAVRRAPAQEIGGGRQRILIVGGGLAGLAAGYELRKAGHDVSIFEAQPRAGGRILTLRGFDENLYADAGAARIHRDHELTHQYVREFNLPLVPFYPSAGKYSILDHGKAARVDWAEYAEAVETVAALEKPDRWQKIAGGNDLLPRAFAQRLKDKIRYGSPVVRIAHDAAGATVTFLENGKPQSVRGDRLICAIPFTTLRRIEIDPPFAEAKTALVQNLKYHPASRVMLQTKRRFWASKGLNGFGFGADFAEIWHSTFGQRGTRGVLQTYLRDDYALSLTSLSEEERLAGTIRALEKQFAALRADFEKGATKCWSEDPWALGAWASAGKDVELVKRPEGRVHFAGDHASRMPSWMQGALESAQRVAEEIKTRPSK